jgi:hypothetical protein
MLFVSALELLKRFVRLTPVRIEFRNLEGGTRQIFYDVLR